MDSKPFYYVWQSLQRMSALTISIQDHDRIMIERATFRQMLDG